MTHHKTKRRRRRLRLQPERVWRVGASASNFEPGPHTQANRLLAEPIQPRMQLAGSHLPGCRQALGIPTHLRQLR